MEAAGGQPRADSAAAPRTEAAAHVCPDFHAAIELIGRRWAGAILWCARRAARTTSPSSAARVPGLSDRLLSRRLRELEAAGLVERSRPRRPPARVSYALTEKGRGARAGARASSRTGRERWKLSS